MHFNSVLLYSKKILWDKMLLFTWSKLQSSARHIAAHVAIGRVMEAGIISNICFASSFVLPSGLMK